MSEEEELKGIRREVWWLSTFLVKIPLIISAFAAVGWLFSQVDCSNSSQQPLNRPDYWDGFWEDGWKIYLAIVIVVATASYFIIRYAIPWFKKP